MKIKELIAKTPEMSEEKLIKIIDKHHNLLRSGTLRRVISLNLSINEGAEAILKEYDKIQDKSSYLTKSQRDEILGFVGLCMIKMVKDDGGNSEGGSKDSVGTISKPKEIGDNPEL
jgi:hypothetical protein